MTPEVIVALIISVLSLLLAARQFIYQKNNDAAKIIKDLDSNLSIKIATLIEKVAKLESAADYSWRMIEMYAGQILHHPVTPEIDRYIDKNESHGLTRREALEFADILDSIIKSEENDGRRAAATLMLAAIARRYKLSVRI